MAGVAFAVVLAMTLMRSILVVDAVTSPPGTSSRLTARATQAFSSRMPTGVGQGSGHASPRQRAQVGTSSTVRTLHKRLLAMHLTAVVCMMAGVAKYCLPVSTMSCRVTGAVLMGTVLLYDASLVLFLLAKTNVTNGNRALSKWETCITWWSRFYSWGYLSTCAVFLGIVVRVTPNDESTLCFSGSNAEGGRAGFEATVGYLSNSVVMIIQFVLLLAMFVKPMLLPRSTQSGGAVYRRVIIRNIVCTTSIVLTYTASTSIMVLSSLTYTIDNEQMQVIMDVAPAINMILTLCLTEIALPLGISSCFKSVMEVRHLQTNQTQQLAASATTMKTQVKTITGLASSVTKQQPTRTSVVPIEREVP